MSLNIFIFLKLLLLLLLISCVRGNNNKHKKKTNQEQHTIDVISSTLSYERILLSMDRYRSQNIIETATMSNNMDADDDSIKIRHRPIREKQRN